MPSRIAAIGGAELFLFARYPQEIKNRDVRRGLVLLLLIASLEPDRIVPTLRWSDGPSEASVFPISRGVAPRRIFLGGGYRDDMGLRLYINTRF